MRVEIKRRGHWSHRRTSLLASALLLSGFPVLADSISGKDELVCSAGQVTVCTPDGVCDRNSPQGMQIPQFLVIDLSGKRLTTTEASGENRHTEISHLARRDELIVLQGSQGGRAFSMMISETTGLASIAVVLEGVAIGVFGACTPIPVQ